MGYKNGSIDGREKVMGGVTVNKPGCDCWIYTGDNYEGRKSFRNKERLYLWFNDTIWRYCPFCGKAVIATEETGEE